MCGFGVPRPFGFDVDDKGITFEMNISIVGVYVFTYEAYEISGGQTLVRNTRTGVTVEEYWRKLVSARVLNKMSLKVVSLCFLHE